jgi:hypothetical protein
VSAVGGDSVRSSSETIRRPARQIRAIALTDRLAAVAVAAGVALQLAQFAAGKSLSLDESLLALNVTDRSFVHLFGALDFNQAAPPGFLAVEKALVGMLGNDDRVLRAFPLAAGIAALVVFPLVARRVLHRTAVPVACALFALSDALVYWTSTDKQYAVDVVGVLVVFLLGLRASDSAALLPIAVLGGAGALLVWLSHPVIFALGGVTTVSIVSALLGRRRGELQALLAAGLGSLASFVLAFTLTRSSVEHVQRSLAVSNAFVSPTGSSAPKTALGAFRYLAGIHDFLNRGGHDAGELVAAIGIVFSLVGFVSLLRRTPRRALLLVSPIPFLAAASVLHRYPILDRTVLFLLPIPTLLLAAGMAVTVRAARTRTLRVGAVALGAVVVLTAVVPSFSHVGDGRSREEMKPAMAYLAEHQTPTDSVYLFYTAQYGFRHYLECRCAGSAVAHAEQRGLWPVRRAAGGTSQWASALVSTSPRLMVGRYRGLDPSLYLSDFRKLQGRRRVWIMLSDIPASEREKLLHELDGRGTRRASFRAGPSASTATVYLYDFRP